MTTANTVTTGAINEGPVWRKPLNAACLLSILLTFSQQVSAQLDTGKVVGTVQDQSGALIRGASVTLTSEGTGLALKEKSGSTGTYVFPSLKLGTYTLQVEMPGFENVVRRGLEVHVQQELTVDIVLVPGQPAEVVTVTAASPLLQTEDAALGQYVGGREVNDLPLNGRNWTSLSQISAGVATGQLFGPSSSYFSANGTSYLQNDFRLNGINNNNEMYNFMTVYSVLPPPDAIEEFKLQTGNYSAEFGHSGGAIVNASLKSGTNAFHGSLWEFLRNDKLDAANFFENAYGTPKGGFQQNQFGGALGGPVELPHIYNGKNKTFFFFDYQGTRIRQASPSSGTVPTEAMRTNGYTNLQDLITYNTGTRTDSLGRVFPAGAVLDPATTREVTKGQVDPVTGLVADASGFVRDPFFPGPIGGITNFTSPAVESQLNLIPASRIDPNAVKLLNLYPAPNLPGLFNNFNYDPKGVNDTNQFDIRIDHNFSSKDQILDVMSWGHNLILSPNLLPGLASGQGFTGSTSLPHQAYAFSYTHSFTTSLLNEARFGYNRNIGNAIPFEADQLGIPSQYGIQDVPQVPGNGGLPNIPISGLTGLGVGGYLPTLSITQSMEFNDNLSKIYRSHTFKVGVSVDRIRGGVTQPAYSRGSFSFTGGYTGVPNQGGATGIADLLLTPTTSTVPGGFNYVGGASTVTASNIANTDDSRWYNALYFQDDWKVTPRLTLNLGLRWDYFTPYNEKYGAQAAFLPAAGNVSQAEYLIPQSRCHDPRSPSFNALAAQDGITIQCSDNAALGVPQKTNFGPRIGFAYRVAPKLVVRGGYGISYGALGNTGYGYNLGVNYPFLYNFRFNSPDAAHPITYSNGSIAALETGLTGIPLDPLLVNGEGLSLNGRQYDFKTPYFQQFNFTLQQQIYANQSVQLGYVGTLGRHMDNFPGANLPGIILPPAVNPQQYVPFPDFGRGSPFEATAASSHYNSLQAGFERRFSGGLYLMANYTYSKCLSDYRGAIGNANGGYRAPYLAGFGIRGDYGLCEADITNVFHSVGSYILPIGKGKLLLGNSGNLVDAVLGGWSLNYILTLQGGQPFTVGCPISTTSDFGCNALLVPGQDIYAGPHNVNQWLNPAAFAQPPVATQVGQTNFAPLGGATTQARGPGIARMDFSLFKNFPIKEHARLEFRTEVFNLTNTPSFGQPAYLDFTNTATFGRITSLRDGANDPREIQFAMKLYW